MLTTRHALLTCTLLAALMTLASGCAEPTSDDTEAPSGDYNPEWNDQAPRTLGKADFLGAVPQLVFGEEANGQVDSKQVDLYRLELQKNDSFTIVMNVTQGDLAPDFLLYEGNTPVRSTSYDVDSKSLSKTYTVDRTGDYAVLVRAYRERGEGSYGLTATCQGGPCNGEVDLPDPAEQLDGQFVETCLNKTRQLTLSKMTSPLDAAQATQLFQETLLEVSAEEPWSGDLLSCGAVCAPTRVGYDREAYYCEYIGHTLATFSDKTDACKDTLEHCMGECAYQVDLNSYSSDDYEEGYYPESQCLFTGHNGTCGSYALGMEACDGPLEDGSDAACMLECWSTVGAVIDGLSSLCDDDCDCDDACYEELDNL